VPSATISTPVQGASTIRATDSLWPIVRTLYTYENKGLQATSVIARDLYTYENKGLQTLSIASRELYLYEDKGIWSFAVVARGLYDYENTHDLPVQPWLNSIDPAQQYPLGTVDLYGDGLGQFTEVAAGSTITASSTNGSNVPGNTVVRTSATSYWQSNDGYSTVWIRFTFGTALTIYAISLEDRPAAVSNLWGYPLFRFSDGGADVQGATAVPIPDPVQRSTQYPVGTVRTLYILPTERTGITWVEVRCVVGLPGAGSARGLSQVWIYADEGQNAEASIALLNALSMGVAGAWLNRSPNLWPANSGVPLAKAVTVTVPSNGVSGLVKVQES
jgi:hypothetical protein